MWAEAGPATDSRPVQLSGRAAMDAICLEASPPPILHPESAGTKIYPGCKPLKIHKTGKSSTSSRPKDGVAAERYADLRIAGEPGTGGARAARAGQGAPHSRPRL